MDVKEFVAMTLSNLKSLFFKELTGIYPNEEILSFYYILIKHRLKLEKTAIFLEPNSKVSKNDFTYLDKAILSLKQEKPVQYITGKTQFYGLDFKVNQHVLIPRPETEELVNWILSDIKHREETSKNKQLTTKDQRPHTILDIGTGSGCIAISLAKNIPKSKISAIDISNKALETAKENANINAVKVNFIEQDILSFPTKYSSSNSKKYDIIVSNPPYVRELEKQEMKKNVLQNEPPLALFVDNENPLLFYNKIADFALENLFEDGKLFLEINQYLAIETVSLLKQKGFRIIELREDIFGNKRMLKATLKSNL